MRSRHTCRCSRIKIFQIDNLKPAQCHVIYATLLPRFSINQEQKNILHLLNLPRRSLCFAFTIAVIPPGSMLSLISARRWWWINDTTSIKQVQFPNLVCQLERVYRKSMRGACSSLWHIVATTFLCGIALSSSCYEFETSCRCPIEPVI